MTDQPVRFSDQGVNAWIDSDEILQTLALPDTDEGNNEYIRRRTEFIEKWEAENG